MSQISPFYNQLAKIFELLEEGRFTPDKDFGANPVENYSWYISPGAANFLNKRNAPEWLEMRYNPQIKMGTQQWDGYNQPGMTIQLIIVGVPVS